MTLFNFNHRLEDLFSKHSPVLKSWGQDFSQGFWGHKSALAVGDWGQRLQTMNSGWTQASKGTKRKDASLPSEVGTVAPELAVERGRDHLYQGALKGPHWLWLGFLETE